MIHRTRFEPRRAEQIPGHAAVEAQLQVIILAAQLGEHAAAGVGVSTGLVGWCTSPMTMAGPSDVRDSGQRGRRARSPNPTPILANQIRQVLTRSWPARNTATPGAIVAASGRDGGARVRSRTPAAA